MELINCRVDALDEMQEAILQLALCCQDSWRHHQALRVVRRNAERRDTGTEKWKNKLSMCECRRQTKDGEVETESTEFMSRKSSEYHNDDNLKSLIFSGQVN